MTPTSQPRVEPANVERFAEQLESLASDVSLGKRWAAYQAEEAVDTLLASAVELRALLARAEAAEERERGLAEALKVYADGSTWGVTRAYSEHGHVIWLGEQSSPWADAREALAGHHPEAGAQ